MDISDGEDNLGPDFLAPIPLPEVGVGEVGVGDVEEVAVQDGENGATDNCEDIPVIQQPGVGVLTPRAIT